MRSRRHGRNRAIAEDRSPRKLTVYYDGACAMCSTLMGAVRESRQRATFKLCDMHATPSLPFDKTAVEREIHVVDENGRVYRGAPAILRIAAQYRHLSAIAALGRFAPIRPALALGYRAVAANRRFLFGPISRIWWLKVAVLAAFCVGLLISSPLWIGARSYPLSPVFAALPALPWTAGYLLFAALYGLAGGAVISPKPRQFIAAFVTIVVVLCLFDQTRWQPWVYLYCSLLVALAAFSWDSTDDEGRKRALNIARLIIVGTYFFSGLQKFNWNFVAVEFPGLTEPITDHFRSLSGGVHVAAMAAPFIQVGFAIGLLTERFRRASLIVAVAMHAFILLMLGPLGQNWNVVVWPWTAAMAVVDILLFGGREHYSWQDIFTIKSGRLHALALVSFAMMPFFSFVNVWDSYLSAALYSGNLTQATLYVSDAGARALPAAVQRYLVHTSPDTNVLNFERWSIEDLAVPPYPEPRVYKMVAREFCAGMPDARQLVLILREQRMFFSKPESGYRCDQL